MSVSNPTMAAVFSVPQFQPKPRSLRQTWLKDVGYDEAPYYVERMGLTELADFLDVAAERIDFVKITTPQILYSPEAWLKRKVETYRSHGIEPYLDHTYFKHAYRHGVVEKAIEAGRHLGFRVIEFMNTGTDVTPEQWRAWRQIAIDNEMRIIYEHHPARNWTPHSPNVPSRADDIINGAISFLDHGAFTLLLDHEEFELQGDSAADTFGKIVTAFGLSRVVFEVTSPKEDPHQWQRDLTAYFRFLGADANVSNVMPSQILFVQGMREAAMGAHAGPAREPFRRAEIPPHPALGKA